MHICIIPTFWELRNPSVSTHAQVLFSLESEVKPRALLLFVCFFLQNGSENIILIYVR